MSKAVILVHGLWTGGWAMQGLRLLLSRRGYAATALDYRSMAQGLDEHARRLQGIAGDRACALGAVRQPCGVTEIDERLVRQRFTQRPEHGESADTGVEYTDRQLPLVPGHELQLSGLTCGNSSTSRMAA